MKDTTEEEETRDEEAVFEQYESIYQEYVYDCRDTGSVQPSGMEAILSYIHPHISGLQTKRKKKTIKTGSNQST